MWNIEHRVVWGGGGGAEEQYSRIERGGNKVQQLGVYLLGGNMNCAATTIGKMKHSKTS